MDDIFHKGVAISVWQNSGGENSNWGEFAENSKCCGLLPNIQDGSHVGVSCNFWEKYESDIALLAKLGATAFRFSFEWHRIESEPGVIDQGAIDHYHKILDVAERHKLVPNATMHHFVHPLWFQHMGGFENPQSVDLFVNFARVLYNNFGKRVTFWSTFNEPTCAMFCGWVLAVHPPGKFLATKTAGTMLMHMLMAHVRTYFMIKGLPGGKASRIGIVHHNTWFTPVKNVWYYAHVRYACKWMQYFWGREVLLKFFQKGEFEWSVPIWGKVLSHSEPDAPKSLDYFGINYYSHGEVNFFLQPKTTKDDVKTDMGYNMLPGGVYDSIAFWSVLGKPMYITETGCADVKDAFRDKFIRTYFDSLVRAVRDGYDIRGFYYWTLMDNFEWNTGFSKKFGLYEWTQGSDKRTLRDKSHAIIDLYEKWPSPWSEFKAAAMKVAPDKPKKK